MNGKIELKTEMIDMNIGKLNQKDALIHLSNLLVSQGMVKPGYDVKILERESSYPTGLQFPDITVAIPHGDSSYALKTAMAIGRCNPQIGFHSMEDIDSVIPVDLIVMLSVVNPDEHVMILNKLMEIFADGSTCKKIMSADTAEELNRIFNEKLYDSKEEE